MRQMRADEMWHWMGVSPEPPSFRTTEGRETLVREYSDRLTGTVTNGSSDYLRNLRHLWMVFVVEAEERVLDRLVRLER